MFGYMNLSPQGLTIAQQVRYQAYYCGLCRTLKERHGNLARLTLSNDMTFLHILLSSLYEPQETEKKARCLPHPIRRRAYVQNAFSGYCADMNVVLAYHKCLDDWKDDRSPLAKAQAALLQKGYAKAAAVYPKQCMAVEECLQAIAKMEREGLGRPDAPANKTAHMLGTIFRFQREDEWTGSLQAMGEGLGRFIYLIDAYDDLQADIRKGRYNPLRDYAKQADYDELCKDSLTLLIAECTAIFETLPLVMDVEILRSILYAGIWSRYEAKRKKREEAAAKTKGGGT